MVSLGARLFLLPLVVLVVAARNASGVPIDLSVIGIWSENTAHTSLSVGGFSLNAQSAILERPSSTLSRVPGAPGGARR